MNDRGVVHVRHFAAESGHVVELRAVGAHLVTHGADRSLTLGSSKRTYYFASPDAAPFDGSGDELLALATAAGPAEETFQDLPALSELGDPIGVATSIAGLSLESSRRRTGVTIGVRSLVGLAIPTDFDGIVWIQHGDADAASPIVFIREVRQ